MIAAGLSHNDREGHYFSRASSLESRHLSAADGDSLPAVTDRTGWMEIPSAERAEWNGRLLGTDASLFQYPYWNEPLRSRYCSPQYLSYCSGASPVAYACVLSVGIPGLRAGLVQRGPVSLTGEPALGRSLAEELVRWARRRGYMFLRITHSEPDVLEQFMALDSARRLDAFPFYGDPQEHLLVEQRDNDGDLLRAFQPVARRNLRRAAEAGYEIQASDLPETLRAVWPLFASLARRKGFRFRPRASFESLMRLARPWGAAKLYTASLNGQPVEAILIVRDRDTAHYVIGALDVDSLGGRESPSVLLHWQAMRDFGRLRTRYYNLGTRSGTVYRFKQKFRPAERRNPHAVTVVTNAALYGLWAMFGLRLMTRLWPSIRAALAR